MNFLKLPVIISLFYDNSLLYRHFCETHVKTPECDSLGIIVSKFHQQDIKSGWVFSWFGFFDVFVLLIL